MDLSYYSRPMGQNTDDVEALLRSLEQNTVISHAADKITLRVIRGIFIIKNVIPWYTRATKDVPTETLADALNPNTCSLAKALDRVYNTVIRYRPGSIDFRVFDKAKFVVKHAFEILQPLRLKSAVVLEAKLTAYFNYFSDSKVSNYTAEQYAQEFRRLTDEVLAALNDLWSEIFDFEKSLVAPKSTPKPKTSGASPREERVRNEQTLAKALHDTAFAMLAMPSDALALERKKFAQGAYWSKVTKIRQGTIGKLIDLRGSMASRGEKPCEIAQFYFMLCTNEDAFMLFREIECEKTSPRNALDIAEHYRRLKNEFESRLKAHK